MFINFIQVLELNFTIVAEKVSFGNMFDMVVLVTGWMGTSLKLEKKTCQMVSRTFFQLIYEFKKENLVLFSNSTSCTLFL